MKRPEHIIEDLITRQLDGTPLTDTERRELQEWLEASEANRNAFLRAYKAWGNARLAETRFNTSQALENVMARIAEASRPRSFLRPQLRRLGIGIAAAACVMLVVPYGKQTTLTLADGTRVWINAGSRLVYPVVFEKQKREIYVEGEIYMEVAHDAERPFSVHTGKMDVCVLGTKFYISSYGRDRTQEVVLLSGSVSVAPAGRSDRGIRIVPGQQAILDTSESLEVREVEAESYISWIHGYLPFDNDPLSNILERLSRYYNCRIECTPEAEALTLSGKLELKDDPAEVLKILSATAPINLQISGSGNFRIDYNPTTNNPN